MGTAGIDILQGIFHRGDPAADDAQDGPELEQDDTSELPAIIDDRRPVVVVQRAQMTYARHLFASYRHVRRMAKDEGQRDGTPLRRALNARWSIQDDFDYATGRRWLLPGQEGTLIEVAGVLYFALIGRQAVLRAGFKRWIYARPLRCAWYWASWVAVACAVLAGLHHRAAAELLGMAVFGPLAVIIGISLVARPRHRDLEDEEIVEEEVPE